MCPVRHSFNKSDAYVHQNLLVAAAAAATIFTGSANAAPVEYTVGTGATYRPFEFQAPTKEIVGFDIDLMKEIAKAQGFKVKFVNTLWGVIFESVKTATVTSS